MDDYYNYYRRLLLTQRSFNIIHNTYTYNNIDFLINHNHQDIRQCHFPGDQNRPEDRYEEEAHDPQSQRGRSTCISIA